MYRNAGHQQPDGVFSRIPPTEASRPVNASYASGYNHPITGLMLSEAYSCFYSSMEMFQLGGKHWQEFYPVLARTLIANQRRDGSWEPDCHPGSKQFGEAMPRPWPSSRSARPTSCC